MNLKRRLSLSILVVTVSLFGLSISQAAVIYVDTDSMATHDGQSWQTAFNYLQDALTVASYGDQIRVAQGVYRPDESLANPDGTGEPNNVFDLADGIILQGGYAGIGETDPNTRDAIAYETILSGDLDGNDTILTNANQILTDPNRSDNSYHVLRMTESTLNLILDGFTITGGMAIGADPYNNGGAIQIVSSEPNISNCRFEYNAAANGGAIYNITSSPILTNCFFFRNYAQNAGGGLRNITFSNPTLSNCTFVENKAAGYGGGMANSNNSGPTVMQCTFSYNWANQGGAINNYDFCNPQIIRSIFLYNATDTNGGALSNQNHSDAELIHCGLFSNAAPFGGGLYNDQSDPKMVNCIASGNVAVESGGVLYNRDAIDVSMTNCTFVGNTAAVQGASLYNVFSNPTIQNCILWDGADPNNAPIYTESGSLTVNYSCIQGGWTGGTGNIDADPLFIDPNGPDGMLGTTDDNFRLLADSLCIDAGDNTVVPADLTDLDNDGNVIERIPLDYNDKARFVDVPDAIDTGLADLPTYPDVIDMGALERSKPILVDILSPGPEHDGTGWDKAFNHLQDALAIAEKGDVIMVAQGVYCPDRSQVVPTGSGDRTAAFDLIDSVVLQGGYAGWSQADPNVRDTQTYPTILSGDLLDNDTPVTDPAEMINDPNRSDNSYHVLTSENTNERTELSGFMVTGGMAVGTDPHNTGGGIRMSLSNLMISNCSFEYNAGEYGGAVYNSTSSPALLDCVFSRNYALNHGGVIRNYNFSSPELSNCTFIENKAAGYGGAMANSNNSSPSVMQCSFSYNWANQGGVAINNYGYCSPQISESIFEYNATDNAGGALRNENNSDAESINCDFTANTALSGAAIYNDSSAPMVIDCNFIDNAAIGNGGAIFSTNSALMVQTSAFITNQSGNYGGALYNVTLSPLGVIECTFTSNTAVRGGAVFCNNSASTVTGSIFLDNTTINSDVDVDESGGAIYNSSTDLSITESIFQGNISYMNGGAVYNIDGNLTIENSIIRDNQSGKNGGGVCDITANMLDLTSCIFSSNTAIYDGGGVYIQNVPDADLVNCLIAHNDADYGGGIATAGTSTADIIHCTLSGNVAGIGDGIYNSGANNVIQNSIVLDTIIPASNVAIDYSCVPDWTGSGIGNITQNPSFADADGADNIPGTTDDNYRLTAVSPCLDSADNTLIPAGIETDLQGHLRIVDGNCSSLAIADMGAYEFSYLSMGDFDLSCSIDLIDFVELADAWLTAEGDAQYNSVCDISIPNDHRVDGQDLVILCQNWLLGNE